MGTVPLAPLGLSVLKPRLDAGQDASHAWLQVLCPHAALQTAERPLGNAGQARELTLRKSEHAPAELNRQLYLFLHSHDPYSAKPDHYSARTGDASKIYSM